MSVSGCGVDGGTRARRSGGGASRALPEFGDHCCHACRRAHARAADCAPAHSWQFRGRAISPPPTPTSRPQAVCNDLARRVSFPKEGVYNGRKIGTWGRTFESTLTAKPREMRNCATEEEATAWARSLQKAAAVFKENVYIAPAEP